MRNAAVGGAERLTVPDPYRLFVADAASYWITLASARGLRPVLPAWICRAVTSLALGRAAVVISEEGWLHANPRQS